MCAAVNEGAVVRGRVFSQSVAGRRMMKKQRRAGGALTTAAGGGGGGEHKFSMPSCQSKLGSKTKKTTNNEDFDDILPRKRWSHHSFSSKALVDICQKEGLAPLSPFPLQPTKQSRLDMLPMSKIIACDKDRTMASRLNEYEIRSEGPASITPRTEQSIHNIVQLRLKRVARQPVDNFRILPDEMILKIFKWLPKQALGRVAQTCKRLKRLADDETLWRKVDLQGKILNPGHLGILLSRQPLFVRLARAQVLEPLGIPPDIPASQLMYLDLSMAVVSSDTLTQLLSLCTCLVKLSLEHMVVPQKAIEAMHVFASTLDTLNVTMCYELDANAFASLLKKCKNLKNLNMGCISQDWSSGELLEVVSSLPSKMEQLNCAGFKQGMTDAHVEVIVSRCPRLVDLDLSDSQDITMASIESITTLNNLQHLALSRCYAVQPVSYALLAGMRRLQFLEVFSVFKESSLKNLAATIPGVGINKFYFSAVARPTVGDKRSSIWAVRVRD